MDLLEPGRVLGHGQLAEVVQQAEGFSAGPATGVGVIAALLILLLTFGSLAAAGLPVRVKLPERPLPRSVAVKAEADENVVEPKLMRS